MLHIALQFDPADVARGVLRLFHDDFVAGNNRDFALHPTTPLPIGHPASIETNDRSIGWVRLHLDQLPSHGNRLGWLLFLLFGDLSPPCNCDDWTGIDEAKAKLLVWRSQGVGEAVDKAHKDERQQVYYVAHDVLADLNIPHKEALQYFKECIAKEIQS